MTKPVCFRCKRFFKPKRTGVRVLEQMPINNKAEPGTAAEEEWQPYKVWQADMLTCHGCGTEIIVGFAAVPLSEHYLPNFKDVLAAITHTVNDC